MDRPRILWQCPRFNPYFADYYINMNYKDAFVDLGYTFDFLTGEDDLIEKVNRFKPDILVTATQNEYFEKLDIEWLNKKRKEGLFVIVAVEALEHYDPLYRLENKPERIRLIQEGKLGDMFFGNNELERMKGFKEKTGYKYHFLPLAANHKVQFGSTHFVEKKYECAYVGNYMLSKKEKFAGYIDPLKNKHNLKLIGNNWTLTDRAIAKIHRMLKIKQKPKITLDQERELYWKTKIGLNLHEKKQAIEGLDVNERTFKVPACGCFELCDANKSVYKYFAKDEVILAEDEKDWYEKIEYYLENDEEREKIAEKGYQRVQKEHLYTHRVKKMIEIYKSYL
ncbi:MAG TPA: glycosyltransferase [Candidatus Bilamarchaeaceae archaeon]|nr:glycosyltransferase [Candidatus Bilamarchaeaceae archaeon]